jgi:hypothetical protein
MRHLPVRSATYDVGTDSELVLIGAATAERIRELKAIARAPGVDEDAFAHGMHECIDLIITQRVRAFVKQDSEAPRWWIMYQARMYAAALMVITIAGTVAIHIYARYGEESASLFDAVLQSAWAQNLFTVGWIIVIVIGGGVKKIFDSLKVTMT